jgi:peptide/nickel transport system ATP-binding protein
MGSIIVPEEGLKAHKLTAIPGAPPNLKNVLTGCRFAERCKHADDECRRQEIPETNVGPRMYRCRFSVQELKEKYAHE